MLTTREAFKVGFLSRCIEEGLGPEEAAGAAKVAFDKLALFTDLPEKLVTSAGSAAAGAAGTGLKWGIPLMLGAPPILGGLAGFGASKLTDIDDRDVDEIKSHELIDEYARQTERLQRDRKIRDSRGGRKQPVRSFL